MAPRLPEASPAKETRPVCRVSKTSQGLKKTSAPKTFQITWLATNVDDPAGLLVLYLPRYKFFDGPKLSNRNRLAGLFGWMYGVQYGSP